MNDDGKSTSTLIVVTGNKAKAAEISAITGWSAEAVPLDLPEIQSLDVEEVARIKAQHAFKQIQQPLVVDDTGMSIEALNGLPGALVSWFLDAVGPEGLLKMISWVPDKERGATVSTCIAYADSEDLKTFTGCVSGRLSDALKGTHGFGYDPIFIPAGQHRTYAEMTPGEKNENSMRKIALVKLKDYLSAKWA